MVTIGMNNIQASALAAKVGSEAVEEGVEGATAGAARAEEAAVAAVAKGTERVTEKMANTAADDMAKSDIGEVKPGEESGPIEKLPDAPVDIKAPEEVVGAADKAVGDAEGDAADNILGDEGKVDAGATTKAVKSGAKTAGKQVLKKGVKDVESDGEAAATKGAEEGTEESTEEGADKVPSKEDLQSEVLKKQLIKLDEDEAAKVAEKEAATAAEKEANSFLGKIKSGGSAILGAAEHLGSTLANAVLFMIPNVFESAFLAQQQLNAMLTTYAAPIQFGNIVLQIPDSAMNMSTPASSDFIYYGIPVTSITGKVSAGASAMYPGVHGPDKNNKITAGVHQGLTQAFSLGSSKNQAPARYDLDAKALSSLPIFVSYSSQSWSTWGASGIPDPTFTQMLINLNTGYVFYADGLSNDTEAAGLVGKGSKESVQSYLATKLGQISTGGAMHSYTQYQDTFSSSHGSATASPISNQFNCACLMKNGEVLSADTMKGCASGKNSTCLLVPTLNALSAGLIINADGKKMTKDQDLTEEIKKGALGQVIPIKGLGDKFEDYLKFFPGEQKDAIEESGPLTISLGFGAESADGTIATSKTAAKDVKVKGGDPDNYAAKGLYVYQCQNTEFAKMLRSQAGGADTSTYNNHVYDFIVFLDKELNQVPLMAPAQNPANFHFPEMELNPAIQYVSTIIGNGDSSGFSLLPQLNIKSSPALIAKGMPATFAPLFGLNAQGGSLSISYNQNINSKIGPMSEALESHHELGQQYKDIKEAMLRMLYDGPFGKYKLKPIDTTMQPVIGGVNLVMYTGFNSYPVPQDENATNCTDVLVPMSAQGKTVVLPSNNVALYYGLVSDLTYTVGPDGSLKVLESGYAHSPFSQQVDASTKKVTWKMDNSQVDTYYWLTQLTNMGKANDPKFALPDSLVEFVQARRGAWVTWVNKSSVNQLENLEYSGIPWTGTDNTLTIIGQQALANKLYVYTCNPNPSKLTHDYFVLTNSNNPVASDKTLGTMSAMSATSKTNMLSMVSGLLYNSSGAPVKNVQGVGYQIDSKDLIQSLFATNPKGFADDFKADLNVAYGQFMAAENMPVYPFEFYNLKLGLYQADINRGTFVYFDAAGAGSSDDFEPEDYFVTVDLNAKPVVWAEKLTGKTQYIMSLITGTVYSQTGPEYALSPDKVTAAIAALSPSWRPGLKDKIDALTVDYVAQQKNDKEATDKMNADINTGPSGEITWKQADVLAIIKSLSSQQYLPAPFDLLKQDPASKKYVRISPASTDGTDFLYTFFDIPNSYTDANGKQIHVGGMFDSQGNQLMLIGNLQLESLLVQNGISVDDAGHESLGASNVLPIMLIDKADHTLKPGATGKSMICSNSKDFPTAGITSPMTYEGRQFYFYFNTIMKTYYVMEINGTDVRYVSMAGGDIYNLDGSCRPVTNPVAFNSADSKDMFFPYLNNNSYTQCMMKNVGNKGAYGDFINIEKSFKGNITFSSSSSLAALNLLVAGIDPYNQVYVLQSPRPATIPPMPNINVATQYNVYWDENNPLTYTVNKDYVSQSLTLLPLNMKDRSFMSPLPSRTYRDARLVLKKGVIDHLLFANDLYVVKTSTANVYTMQQVNNARVAVTVSLKKDATTGVNYAEIVTGSTTYNYEFVFDLLSNEELTNYKYNAWKAEVVASVGAKIILVQYLPSNSSGSVELSTVSLADVENVPDNAQAQAAVTKGITQVRNDKIDGRFVAIIHAKTYSYFNQNGYVDLESGALFDDKGVPVGTTLQVSDLLNLLNELSVSVIRDTDRKAALMYRSAPKKVESSAVAAATQAPKKGILGRMSSAFEGMLKEVEAEVFGPSRSSVKLSAAQQQQKVLQDQLEDIKIEKKNKQLIDQIDNEKANSVDFLASAEHDQVNLEQQVKELKVLKKNENLQAQVKNLQGSVPENPQDEIEELENENRSLQESNDKAMKRIQSLQAESAGKKSYDINEQIIKQRNIIAVNEVKITANNNYMYELQQIVTPASKTLFKAGILGRLSSIVFGR